MRLLFHWRISLLKSVCSCKTYLNLLKFYSKKKIKSSTPRPGSSISIKGIFRDESLSEADRVFLLLWSLLQGLEHVSGSRHGVTLGICTETNATNIDNHNNRLQHTQEQQVMEELILILFTSSDCSRTESI